MKNDAEKDVNSPIVPNDIAAQFADIMDDADRQMLLLTTRMSRIVHVFPVAPPDPRHVEVGPDRLTDRRRMFTAHRYDDVPADSAVRAGPTGHRNRDGVFRIA